LEPYLKETATKVLENTLYNPKIKLAELHYQNSLKTTSLERANNLPILSVFYGFSTFYFKTLSQVNGNTDPFFNQLVANKSQQIGMQLNVPVFNGFRNNKKIDASKIENEKTKLAIIQEKQQLDKQVVLEEQNKKNFLQLKDKLIEKKSYAKASLATTQAKFTNGKVEAIIFSAVKNQFLSAEYEVLKNILQLQYINLRINLLKNNYL
jgi:outer membrane protein